MKKTLILTRRDVAELLRMEDAVPAVEQAFSAFAAGEARMPAKVYLTLPDHRGDFRAMPASMGALAGVKWVNSHPENPARHGLPSVMGTYVLSDAATALPLAILDGTWLTAVRTGAAGAVATRHLARGAPKRIGFVGCGVQARVLHAAHRVLFPSFEALCADVSADAAATFAAEIGGRVATIEEASGAEVVCVATPGKTPVVMPHFLQPGTHVNAMGADAPGKQELHSGVLATARIVVDDMEQATHSGEVNVPLHEGVIEWGHIVGTLGEVIRSEKKGRARPEDITVFDSTGLAVQDLAVAKLVYERARERGAGLEVSLVD